VLRTQQIFVVTIGTVWLSSLCFIIELEELSAYWHFQILGIQNYNIGLSRIGCWHMGKRRTHLSIFRFLFEWWSHNSRTLLHNNNTALPQQSSLLLFLCHFYFSGFRSIHYSLFFFCTLCSFSNRLNWCLCYNETDPSWWNKSNSTL
jgi:hypothetical protein